MQPHTQNIHLAWLTCCGMRFADPIDQAIQDLRNILELPDGCITTVEHAHSLRALLEPCRKALPEETRRIEVHLRANQPGYALLDTPPQVT